MTAIRDSKDPSGPVFVVEPASWSSCSTAVEADRLGG
ncbi:DUF397 domain-containing protein [Saccharopolyspora sp. NPDC003752]